jgi:predicted secreted protein
MAVKTLGSSGILLVGGSAVAYVKNASFSVQNDEVEATDNDSSNGWKDFLTGNRSGTFSFTYNVDALYVGGDAEQKALIDEALEATTDILTFVYKPSGANTNHYQYTFTGYVQEISHDMSNNEVVESTCTVRVTSSIAVAAHI